MNPFWLRRPDGEPVARHLASPGSRVFPKEFIDRRRVIPAAPLAQGSILVQVEKDGGAIGPPSTWTYKCTTVDGNLNWREVENRTLRDPALKYDYAPDDTYAILVVHAGQPYLFLTELPQLETC